jgi:hypothetical protein
LYVLISGIVEYPYFRFLLSQELFEYPYFRFLLISGIVEYPYFRLLLISGICCNTSVLHLEEESPPAGLRILLNILISGFSLSQEFAVTPQCCTLKKNHHPQAFGFY